MTKCAVGQRLLAPDGRRLIEAIVYRGQRRDAAFWVLEPISKLLAAVDPL
jgi:hypothetical protein